jgi:lipopolysaccharide export system protein LptA
MRGASIWTGAAIAAIGALSCLPAAAQTPKAAPGAAPAANPQAKLPYDISADQQEVFNSEHRTVYRGNVVVIQGTDRLNTPILNLFFAQKDPNQTKKPAAASPTATSTFGKLERMEAEGPVYFTTPTQNAKGDHGTYLAADDTITLIGNVVLVQDKNVSTGDKLVINQNNDHATLYSKSGAPQRVRGVFYQDDQNGQSGAGAKPAKPAGSGRP